ncbi:hypothetical protein JHK82_018184 [Glycine max]|uniref:Uncharacterized protein n=1 Tax=Glycine soja TaxID=3848 RepID=A0A0B2QZ19_GLYSO|nr:hypothetical protein JHK87_018074 [Glycine soja]KAG5022266.1 hypothetical protein JHK85_018608 [Glycine max]KAG5142489.1 hypothetical protein JHK82_018184 [Glycine max]KHN25068.1 hypothetical protein glysoja_027482 [Glycine soja]
MRMTCLSLNSLSAWKDANWAVALYCDSRANSSTMTTWRMLDERCRSCTTSPATVTSWSSRALTRTATPSTSSWSYAALASSSTGSLSRATIPSVSLPTFIARS